MFNVSPQELALRVLILGSIATTCDRAADGQESPNGWLVQDHENRESLPPEWSEQFWKGPGPKTKFGSNAASGMSNQGHQSTEEALKQYCTLSSTQETWHQFLPVRQPASDSTEVEDQQQHPARPTRLASDITSIESDGTSKLRDLENQVRCLQERLDATEQPSGRRQAGSQQAGSQQTPEYQTTAASYTTPSQETAARLTYRSGKENARVGKEALRLAQNADARGTPLLARSYVLQALRQFADASDSMVAPVNGQQSFSAALTALRESTDFGRYGALDVVAMQRLVDSHQTPALKTTDLTHFSRSQAGQAYHDLAERYLRLAFNHTPRLQPVASQALALLARTEPFALQDAQWAAVGNQACLLKASLSCDPTNVHAREALGEALVELGLFEQAKWIVEAYSDKSPTPKLLRLMGVINRGLGHTEVAASYEMQSAKHESAQAKRGVVIQMPPNQFAQYSPQQIRESPHSVMNASFGQPTTITPTSTIATQRSLQVNDRSKTGSWSSRAMDRIASPIRSWLK